MPEWDWGKYYPGGTVQAKATNGTMARKMQLWAAMGHACAPDFVAPDFLNGHPEYGWMRGFLRDMKTQPWTLFTAGMTKNPIMDNTLPIKRPPKGRVPD